MKKLTIGLFLTLLAGNAFAVKGKPFSLQPKRPQFASFNIDANCPHGKLDQPAFDFGKNPSKQTTESTQSKLRLADAVQSKATTD